MSTPFTRRNFLQRAALAGGALILPSGHLLTSVGCAPGELQRRTPHYFIFYFMMGGWDLTLTSEPVPPKGDTIWIPYDQDDVVEIGNERFGPAFAPLAPYADRTAILRGIFCDALNHPQARVRMCTGRFKPPGPRPTVPSVQAIIADHLGKEYEIPNLSSDSLRPATFRGDGQDERLEPVRVASIDQLKGLVGWKGDIAKYRRDVEATLAKLDEHTAQRYGDVPLAQDFRTYADLARATLDSKYPERVRNMGSLTGDATMDRTVKNARLAVEAVRQDIAPVITVGSGEFDSHTKSQYATHMAAVTRGMKAVSLIVDGLQETAMPGGKTLLDHTTVVVTSEFSRDPMKNELGGKHHWQANSMIFIGKGVRKGKGQPTLVGACDDGVNVREMNPANGSFKKGAELIEMQNGLATVLAMAGIEPYPYFGPYDPVLPIMS